MRRFSMSLLVIGVLSLLVADVSRADQRHKNGHRGGSPKNSKTGSCPTQSPVVEKGTEVDPGKVDAGTVDLGNGAGNGADDIVLDDDGKMDGDIVVDDTQAQSGLSADVAPKGHVRVINGGKERTASQIQVRGSNGQTKLISGIRLRSASGKPLELQQFRVKTATGQVKTVEGIRARTSSGKTAVLPVSQLRTSDGKTIAFLSPPKGSSLLVTRRANADRLNTSPDKSPK